MSKKIRSTTRYTSDGKASSTTTSYDGISVTKTYETRSRRQIKNAQFIERSQTRRRISSEFSFSIKIFGIAFSVIVLCLILRRLSGLEDMPTFAGFLEMITNVPEVAIPFQVFNQTTLGDWGVFNFLRDFISILLQLVNVAIFLVNGVVSVITYVVYFFQWLF